MSGCTRALGALSIVLVASCSSSDNRIELVFPDEFAANLETNPDGSPLIVTTGLTVTAVEPFALRENVEEGGAKRVVVNCGEIGVFPPVARYDRSENEVPGLPQLLLNREFQAFPLDGEWTLPVPPPTSADDINPWGAVLVHIEARGPGRDFESGTGLDPTRGDETLLEGCFCMRTKEGGDTGSFELDDEVRDACAGLSVFETGPREIELQPVMPTVFKLEPCGVTDLTAASNQVLKAAPGVCVTTIECSQAQGQANCFECESGTCNELKKLSNVPVRVEILGDNVDAGTTFVRGGDDSDEILLTDPLGKVVPEIQVGECVSDFSIRVSLIGRSTEVVDFNVKCVDSVAFDDPGVGSLSLRDDRPGRGRRVIPKAMSVLPSDRGDSRLLLLSELRDPDDSDALPETRVDLMEHSLGRFERVRTATLAIPGETPRGIFGFHYDLRSAEPQTPLIAVATSTKPRDNPKHELLILRVFELDETTGTPILRSVRTVSGPCETCGCDQPSFCESCAEDPRSNGALFSCNTDADCSARTPCNEGQCYCDANQECRSHPCFVSIKQATTFRMAARDLNGDGFADLAVAGDNDFVLTTYYSAPHHSAHDTTAGRVSLPPLEETCKCSSMGKVLQTFEFIQLGGEQDGPTDAHQDLLVGDPTGAYVRYAEEIRLDGLPCDPMATQQSICPPTHTCMEVCLQGENEGRCVERCDIADPDACSNPAQPQCTELEVRYQSGMNGEQFWTTEAVCGGPVVGCRQPNSVWKLTGVADVVPIKLRGSTQFEDAIAVAQGSPVPGNLETGKVRVLFGGQVDLTEVENLPQEMSRRALMDLTPARFDTTAPQGAKSAAVGDFNGDQFDDFAVLYGTSEEVRIWLGSGMDAPVEMTNDIADDTALRPIRLKSGAEKECFPIDDLVVSDFDGDGRAEVVVVCNTVTEESSLPSTVRWFRPTGN